MLQRHATLIIVFLIVAFAVAACFIRTGPRVQRRGQPVYVEKHKPHKHKKQKHHGKD